MKTGSAWFITHSIRPGRCSRSLRSDRVSQLVICGSLCFFFFFWSFVSVTCLFSSPLHHIHRSIHTDLYLTLHVILRDRFFFCLSSFIHFSNSYNFLLSVPLCFCLQFPILIQKVVFSPPHHPLLVLILSLLISWSTNYY